MADGINVRMASSSLDLDLRSSTEVVLVTVIHWMWSLVVKRTSVISAFRTIVLIRFRSERGVIGINNSTKSYGNYFV